MTEATTPDLSAMDLDEAIDKIHGEHFRRDLEQVINRHGIDAALGTPDFMIRTFIQCALSSLVTLDECRREWFGPETTNPTTHHEENRHG